MGPRTCTSSWAALALRTADLSGLEIPDRKGARRRVVCRRIESDPSPQDAAAWVLLNQEGDGAAAPRPLSRPILRLGAARLRYWYRGTQALLKNRGVGRDDSALWCEALEAAVDMYSADGVGRPGDVTARRRLVSYSMAQVTREIYYRYRA